MTPGGLAATYGICSVGDEPPWLNDQWAGAWVAWEAVTWRLRIASGDGKGGGREDGESTQRRPLWAVASVWARVARVSLRLAIA